MSSHMLRFFPLTYIWPISRSNSVKLVHCCTIEVSVHFKENGWSHWFKFLTACYQWQWEDAYWFWSRSDNQYGGHIEKAFPSILRRTIARINSNFWQLISNDNGKTPIDFGPDPTTNMAAMAAILKKCFRRFWGEPLHESTPIFDSLSTITNFLFSTILCTCMEINHSFVLQFTQVRLHHHLSSTC